MDAQLLALTDLNPECSAGNKENTVVSDTGRGGRGRGARGGREGGRGRGRGRSSAGQEDDGTDISAPEGNDSNREGGPGRGGRGAGRGGREGRGRGRGRTEFDRHDGTGRACVPHHQQP